MADEMTCVKKMQPAPGAEVTTDRIPKIGDNDLLVKVKACSICGTDRHIYAWDPPWSEGRVKPPMIFGHEFAGEVVEVGGNAEGFAKGDNVSAETHIYCNHCAQCRNGNRHVCLNVKLLGVDRDGCFAEYVSLPVTNAWKNPKEIPPEIASVQEPLGNAIFTTYSQPIAGQTVTIFGGGPIGLFAVSLAKVAGAAKIMMITGSKTHIELAKKVGADVVINRHEEDVEKRVMDETNGLGADVFLEMSGSGTAINHGLKTLRQGGSASVLGLPPKPVALDWSRDVVLKNIHLTGINGREIFQTWAMGSALLRNKKLDLRPVITHKFRLDEFQKAMDVVLSKECGKVVLFPK